MNKMDLVEISLKEIVPSPTGCALFLGNKVKTFVIYVGPEEGASILMKVEGVKSSRPLTYDLIHNMLLGLGVRVDKVVIYNLKDNTFFARIFLTQKNELGTKIIDIDARPSDCIAIALEEQAPVFIKREIFDELEDVSSYMKKGF